MQSCAAQQELQEAWCLRQAQCLLKLYGSVGRRALAAPDFEAASCCFCPPPARSAAQGRGEGDVTRYPPRPASSEEGMCGRGSYSSLSKDCYSV